MVLLMLQSHVARGRSRLDALHLTDSFALGSRPENRAHSVSSSSLPLPPSSLESFFTNHYLLCMYVREREYVCMHVPRHTCRDQRTAYESWFPPPCGSWAISLGDRCFAAEPCHWLLAWAFNGSCVLLPRVTAVDPGVCLKQ